MHEVIMPKFGQTMTEGTVVKWLKSEGDKVEKGEILLEVETDKVAVQVEATADGILQKILVAEGQTIPVLTPIARISHQ